MNTLKSPRTKLMTLSILFFLALVVIATGSSTKSEVMAVPAATGGFSFDGGSDYVAYCTRCHGGDGRGQTAKGRQTHAGDLTKSRVSDAKGIRMITNGSGEMPAFKKSMSADQIRDVMAYIHGFRQ